MLGDGIFSKIIRKELPCYKIHEDDLTLSFLTLDAINLGHSLVIPKMEVDHWFDLPEEFHLAVHKHAQKIAPAIQKATKARRILSSFIGFEVSHAHYHLVPANQMSEFNFSLAQKFSEQENSMILKEIRSYLI